MKSSAALDTLREREKHWQNELSIAQGSLDDARQRFRNSSESAQRHIEQAQEKRAQYRDAIARLEAGE